MTKTELLLLLITVAEFMQLSVGIAKMFIAEGYLNEDEEGGGEDDDDDEHI